MFNRLLEVLSKNPTLALFGSLCIGDAILVISALAGSVPWRDWFVQVAPNATPAKLELTKLGIAHVVGWTLLPPAYFFVETFTLDDHLLPSSKHSSDPTLKAEYERLRLAQELAAKVWAAVLAAILFLAPK